MTSVWSGLCLSRSFSLLPSSAKLTVKQSPDSHCQIPREVRTSPRAMHHHSGCRPKNYSNGPYIASALWVIWGIPLARDLGVNLENYLQLYLEKFGKRKFGSTNICKVWLCDLGQIVPSSGFPFPKSRNRTKASSCTSTSWWKVEEKAFEANIITLLSREI